MRRVAITGVGAVSALGHDADAFWSALAEGRDGFAPLEGVDASELRFANAAQVRGLDLAAALGRAGDALDRFAALAIVAGREALRRAGLEGDDGARASTAIVTGTAGGGQASLDDGFRHIYREGRARPHPLTIPRVMPNAGASAVSTDLGITGPAFTVSTACASGTHAIGLAHWMVRHGMAERALAGGSDSPFSVGYLRAWDAVRVVAPDTCRPFSRDRKGMILGEGAAMLVLEPLDLARARGATVYAEVVGFGMSADAGHVTQPSADGAARAIRAALADAAVPPEAVGYVNAHGTGTAANDATETAAIRAAFGAHAERLAVSSTKSMHGHALGAAGALEAVATALALRCGLLPPTANYSEPDPACDLDFVPNAARAANDLEHAISSSFAFGGLNAVLVLRRPED